MAYVAKNYEHIQFVAYQTPTFVGNKVEMPDTGGKYPITDRPALAALDTLQNDDEKARVTRFYKIMLFAKQKAEATVVPSKTLRLFMAPEFYFKTVEPRSVLFGAELKEILKGGLGWQSDGVVSACTKCHTTVGVLTRKHHCRLCGLIFCSKCCSEHEVLVGKNTKKTLLVCGDCYNTKVKVGVKRTAGRYGAYSFNTMQNVLECLRKMFTTALWEDWLIVAGTIVSDLPSDGAQFQDINYYLNTAIVIKGGLEGPFLFVHKQNVSSIDGPPTVRGVFSNHQSTKSPYLDVFDKMKTSPKHLDAWQDRFKIDNINYVLEVCLDHSKSIAKGQYFSVSQQADPMPDIHLISSCGMQIYQKSVLAKTNGYVMICDGINNSKFPRSDLRKVTTQGTKTTPAQLKNFQEAAPTLMTTANTLFNVPDELTVKPLNRAILTGDGGSLWAEHSDRAWEEELSTQTKVEAKMFPEKIAVYKEVDLV